MSFSGVGYDTMWVASGTIYSIKTVCPCQHDVQRTTFQETGLIDNVDNITVK
jgi:hypothetical protein